MKKALALLGTIIFVFSIVPMGAFATDSDYSDHTSNIAPYVDTIIRGFTDSNNVVRHTLSITDVELWQEGLPLGIYQLTANVSADCDVIDIDLYFDSGDLMTDQYYQLFDIYITGLVNIDYIEFYQHTTYRSFPIYYATYHQNRLFVMTASNVLQSGGYTLRVHIKRGGFTVSYYNDILSYVYLRELTDLTTTETLAQWYYLTNLLRELDSLEFNISNITIDLTNVQASLTTLENIFRVARQGYTRYLYNNTSFEDPLIAIYSLNNDLSCTGYSYYYRDDDYVNSVNRNFTIALKFDWQDSMYPFFRVTLPLANLPSNFQYRDYDIDIMFGLLAEDADDYNDFVSFNNYSDYCFFNVGSFNGRICLMVYAYYPTPVSQLTGSNARYLYIRFKPTTSGLGTVQFAPPDFTHYHIWGVTGTSQVGFEWMQHIYFDKYLTLLEQLTDQWASYPSGPSDPQDPNQTTNIYDVNIEFNTQVGDISVFENTYSQQLPTYDQSISDQYLVPVSNSYDFSDLNSTFNSIWQSSFQYDTDEEDNIVGVYGIGLYFIIPLVLLVLFALFRRITA